VIGVAGHLRRLAMQRVARQTDDAEKAGEAVPCTLLGPVERRPLGISVDEGDSFPFPAPFASEMQGESRFADAALLVEEGDDHRALFAVIHRSARRPTSEELDSLRLDSKLGTPEAADSIDENGAFGS
jgi:hypothetical protein